MPKFNFNYCKSIFILCLWIKLLLFNYNIQNNFIIIYRQMKWRWKGTYIEAGEFGGGHEQIIIINRAGGTYKWMKVGNRAGWARFVCAVVCAPWYRAMGSGAGGGAGSGSGGAVVVVVVLVVVPSSWWLVLVVVPSWWCWWCRRGGGVGGAV